LTTTASKHALVVRHTAVAGLLVIMRLREIGVISESLMVSSEPVGAERLSNHEGGAHQPLFEQVLFRLVAVLFQVFHEGRAAGADVGVVAG
jgi:hypothetical protein